MCLFSCCMYKTCQMEVMLIPGWKWIRVGVQPVSLQKQREEKEEAAKKAANGGEGKGSTSKTAARSNSVKDT